MATDDLLDQLVTELAADIEDGLSRWVAWELPHAPSDPPGVPRAALDDTAQDRAALLRAVADRHQLAVPASVEALVARWGLFQTRRRVAGLSFDSVYEDDQASIEDRASELETSTPLAGTRPGLVLRTDVDHGWVALDELAVDGEPLWIAHCSTGATAHLAPLASDAREVALLALSGVADLLLGYADDPADLRLPSGATLAGLLERVAHAAERALGAEHIVQPDVVVDKTRLPEVAIVPLRQTPLGAPLIRNIGEAPWSDATFVYYRSGDGERFEVAHAALDDRHDYTGDQRETARELQGLLFDLYSDPDKVHPMLDEPLGWRELPDPPPYERVQGRYTYAFRWYAGIDPDTIAAAAADAGFHVRRVRGGLLQRAADVEHHPTLAEGAAAILRRVRELTGA